MDNLKEMGNFISEKDIGIFRLRRKREKQCFSIINRGKIWYDTLSEEQIKELSIWYKAWLDVTVTLVEPIAPSWLS